MKRDEVVAECVAAWRRSFGHCETTCHTFKPHVALGINLHDGLDYSGLRTRKGWEVGDE